MPTSINVNGTLRLDQTAGLQDNDFAITGDLTGLNATFRTFLLGLAGDLTLSAAQLTYADLVEAAKTSTNYITVTPDGANITNLFFSDSNGDAFDGDQVIYNGSPLQTIYGDNIYFHSYAGGDIVLATTSATEGVGDVVAAFYLNEAGNHLTAGIEMVTFIPIAHPNATNPDDSIDWTDLLNVAAVGSLTFNFDVLDSGKFLWAAIGNTSNALLISGKSLVVDSASKAVPNSSDFVNTSQGGAGATIGIDNQMFTPGDVAVLTLVEGFDPLKTNTGQAHSDYLVDTKKGNTTYEGINYTGYTNVGGARLFFSQDQGAGTFSAKISLWEAGGGTVPEEELAYKGAGTSGAFNDDTAVPVKTVTVYGPGVTPGALGPVIGVWSTSPTGTEKAFGQSAGGVTVTLDGSNGFILAGMDAYYTVAWTVADGDTFNRFQLSALSGKFDIGKMEIDEGLKITEPVGDSLFVDDDGPTAGSPVTKHVDEDAMTGMAGGDLSTGHIETPDDGDGIAGEQDEVTFSQADLAATVNSGTDAPATFGLNLTLANGTAVKTIGGADVFSKGAQVFWNVNGSTIEGVASGRVVFTITRNDAGTPGDPSDDTFTFDLKDQLDHANNSGELSLITLNVTPAFTAKDADNDPVNFGSSALIRVEVENDIPRTDGDTVTKHVDEDAMTGAGGGDLSTGHVEAPDDADGILGEQDEVSFSQADLQSVVTNGADEPVLFSLNLTLANGTAVKTVGGADVFSKGAQVFWNVNGSTIEGVAAGRVVFVITRDTKGTADASDDTFQFDLKDQLDHGAGSGELALITLNVTPAFRAADFDGDAVDFTGSNAIRVEVENDTPRLDGDTITKHVDEDAMTGAGGGDLSTGHIETPDDADGIPGEQDEVNFTQADLQTIVTNGADEPVLFSLSSTLADGTAVKTIGGADVYSQGDQVFYRTVGGVIQGVTDAGTGDERIIFTITRNNGGTPSDLSDDTFTFDLKDQLDHAAGSGELALITLNVTPAFRASDFDGDAVDLTGSNAIRVEVENDVPRPDGDFVVKHVDEDALSVAAGDGDLSTGHIETPDDADGIPGEQDEVSFNQADLQSVVANGADEPVYFNLSSALADGTAVKTIGGANVFSQGDQVVYRTVAGVIQGVTDPGTADERIIFTLTRNNGGTPSDPSDDTFTFDLRDQLDHANSSGELGLLTLNLTPAFAASDYDGDAVDFTGSNAIRVEVENDIPRADGDTITKEVHEDALTGGNTPDVGDAETKVVTVTYTKADLAGLATVGADENLSFSLNTAASGSPGAIIGTNVLNTSGTAVKSMGLNVVWAAGDTPGSLKGVINDGGTITTIFTLTPSVTPGDFIFTLTEQVDHSAGNDDLELLPINLTPAFKGVDFDNDPLTLNANSVVVNVENDLPIVNAQILSKTVDWGAGNSVQSSLNGKVGGDDQASYIIDKYTDLDGYVETLSTDKKTLTYSKDGIVYFTLQLSDTANGGAGGYTFTVNAPPPNEPLELDFADLDSGQNLFGTIAFDKGNVDNNGTPGNPLDDFLPDGGLLTFPSNPDINDLEPGNPAESNDGTMTKDSGTTNTSKGGGPVTIGNSNQAFDHPDEGAWFCYVDNPNARSVSGVGLDPNLADDADNILFNGMIGVGVASVEIVQASGSGTAKRPGPSMLIEAWNLNPGNVDTSAESRAFLLDPTATGTQVNITGIKIYDANKNLIEYRVNQNGGATNGGTLTGTPDSGVTISFVLIAGGGTMTTADDIYSAVVGNLRPNYTIEWITDGNHNAALVQNLTGSYDIGGFNLLQGQDSTDVDISFSIAIEDEDGDLYRGFDTTFDDFKIKVDGTGVNNDPANTPPTGFVTSYDMVGDSLPLTSLSLKNISFIDDSGMAPQSMALESSYFINDSGMGPDIVRPSAFLNRADLLPDVAIERYLNAFWHYEEVASLRMDEPLW